MARTRKPKPAPDPAAVQRLSFRIRDLADPTKMAILLALADGPRRPGDLGVALGAGRARGSVLLKLLRVSGLVDSAREGLGRSYSLTDEGRRVVALVETLAEAKVPPRGRGG